MCIGRVLDGAGVGAIVGQTGIDELDGGLASARAPQPVYPALKRPVGRRECLRRKVEELKEGKRGEERGK